MNIVSKYVAVDFAKVVFKRVGLQMVPGISGADASGVPSRVVHTRLAHNSDSVIQGLSTSDASVIRRGRVPYAPDTFLSPNQL